VVVVRAMCVCAYGDGDGGGGGVGGWVGGWGGGGSQIGELREGIAGASAPPIIQTMKVNKKPKALVAYYALGSV
jgi:hypothetical protein